MRQSTISRSTAETEITVEVNLDGTGAYDNNTGVGFFSITCWINWRVIR